MVEKKAFTAMSICKVEERSAKNDRGRQIWLSAKPSDLYPKLVEVLKDAMATEKIPKDFFGLLQEALDAVKVHPDAFDLALVPYGKIKLVKELEARAAALDACRRWFTRMLKQEVKKPFGLHILAEDKDFRLGIVV